MSRTTLFYRDLNLMVAVMHLDKPECKMQVTQLIKNSYIKNIIIDNLLDQKEDKSLCLKKS